MAFFNRLSSLSSQIANRPLNSKAIADKVFCIGLHKTGTTTLAKYFKQHGFQVTHSTSWDRDGAMLKKYDFFSDGGSHFDGDNELDYERLFYDFRNAKFILQTRDTEKWVVSKLKHAGWRPDTEVQVDDPLKIRHEDWTYKSYLTVKRFIEHKKNYEEKVLSFFAEHGPERLLVVDITKKEEQANEIENIKKFVGLKSFSNINLPHANKRKSSVHLSDETYVYIRDVISRMNSER
ncbi:hypothetical protein FUA23_03880 [Neolewinella aurantiaca]|uniref:Sulfotransferase family protein n=1 Tax=Neolewinella aurantiaca TaxID=2602767 RepID=A0A5C7FLN2_9BACT|nr:sulfotransferase [Neolewinella aurantiaca]TXF90949.1 hypothetical protein FUA23_03880 [Neolewinella aurantiaca]